jgi:hypothetical protein
MDSSAAFAKSEPVAAQFFLTAPECAEARSGRHHGDAGVRLNARMLEAGLANLAMPFWTALAARLMVNRSSPRRALIQKGLTGARRIYFWSNVCLKNRLSGAKGGRPRLRPAADERL